MTAKLTYICDFCGACLDSGEDMLKHEAGHYCLTADEYKTWIELDKTVKQLSFRDTYCHNASSTAALDAAIEAILAFEKAHGLEGKRCIHG